MIELKNVSKAYQLGKNELQILKGIDLKIDKGEFVAIMGPSGSGKSTLMNILGLLDIPSGGSYSLNGMEISHCSEDELAILRRKEIGFIFQQFHLLPRMKAVENVNLPLLYSKRFTSDQGESLLRQVGLEDRKDHKPNELSGGQQQRVAIARSLVNAPQIVFADEPTGNLDSKSQNEILSILKEMNKEGITIIMVTHEEEVAQEAKRLIRLRDGIIQSDENVIPAEHRGTSVLKEHLNLVAFDNLSTKKILSDENQENYLMTLFGDVVEHFHQGFLTLMANKVRTALSVLGILIGVAAVVAMLALGKGVQSSIESQLSSMGSNLLTLRSGALRMGGVAQESGSNTKLTLEDADYLKKMIPGIRRVAPVMNGQAQITFQNKNWSTTVVGGTSDYADMHNSKPEWGRFFVESENQTRARVAVIGQTLVNELFAGKSPIGEMIKINKINFQVIGVLPEKGSSGWRNQDDQILIPVETAMKRLFGKIYVDMIEVESEKMDFMSEIQASMYEVMYQRKRVPISQQDSAFTIMNMADLQSAITESSKTMSLLLSSIAAISLLVGGIGIMNIMLVSVTERTKEIGLRKAIGAKKRDILIQFLSESVVVSLVGGISGIAIGWAISALISAFAGWTTTITGMSVVLSFGFSVLIGVIFGVYPAKKASELHPIDALRSE